MGQEPPKSEKCLVLAGCQSRVLNTGSPRFRNSLISLFSGGTTSSPWATARVPPGQKSFCTSTTINARFFASDSMYLSRFLFLALYYNNDEKLSDPDCRLAIGNCQLEPHLHFNPDSPC